MSLLLWNLFSAELKSPERYWRGPRSLVLATLSPSRWVTVGVILGFLSLVMDMQLVAGTKVLGPNYTIALKMGNCESYFKVSFLGDGQLLGPRS